MSYSELRFPENTLFLVTGGAGFIGSNLCEAILNLGHRVRCLDDLSTGKQANVDLFLDHPNYEFIKGDIKDLDVCMRACEGVDYVLNQAAWGSVPRSVEMPLFYCMNNIQGTLNMLEAARQNGVKRFVYASSSSVYGDEPVLPKREGREGNLLSPYALTKRCDEEWAKQYTMHYGLETVGLRYFNVFGRRQDPNGAYAAVIPKFLKQLLNGETPTIHGDGMQSRDFTYIENVIEANLKACLAPAEAAGEAQDKPSVSPREWAQTAAVGIALRNAGFGLQFAMAGEDFEAVAPKELGQNPDAPEQTPPAPAAEVYEVTPVKPEPTEEELLQQAMATPCPITKFNGKTLREVLTIDPGALRWLATKYQGDEAVKSAAQRICEYAVQQAS